jgi:hypothetical protein
MGKRAKGSFCSFGVIAIFGLVGCFGKGVSPNIKDGGAADRGSGDGTTLVDSGNPGGGGGGTTTSTASSASPGTGGGGGTAAAASTAGISSTGGFSALGGGGTSGPGSGGASSIGGISTGGKGSTGDTTAAGGGSRTTTGGNGGTTTPPAGSGGTTTVGGNGGNTKPTAGSSGNTTVAGSGGTTTPGSSSLAAGSSGVRLDAGNVDSRPDVAADTPTLGAPGAKCSVNGDCAAGNCVNEVCCKTQCGECNSCSTGTCTPIAGGTVCGGGGSVCVSGACQAGCWIAGQYVSGSTTNSSNACQSCQPTTNTSAWSIKNDGSSCGTGKSCSSGACQCTAGTDCGASGCIDVNGNDNNHCGSCTKVCPAGQTCTTGTCACTKGAPACGGCLAWDFEWGSDPAPWVREIPSYYASPNGATNLAITSSERHGGSSALVAPVSIGTADRNFALVAAATSCSTNLAGYSMSAWVFLAGPALTNWNSAIFIQTWGSSGAGDRNGQYFGNVPTGRWFEVTISFTTPTLVDRIGIELVPNTDWVGTMYIDDVVLTGL